MRQSLEFQFWAETLHIYANFFLPSCSHQGKIPGMREVEF